MLLFAVGTGAVVTWATATGGARAFVSLAGLVATGGTASGSDSGDDAAIVGLADGRGDCAATISAATATGAMTAIAGVVIDAGSGAAAMLALAATGEVWAGSAGGMGAIVGALAGETVAPCSAAAGATGIVAPVLGGLTSGCRPVVTITGWAVTILAIAAETGGAETRGADCALVIATGAFVTATGALVILVPGIEVGVGATGSGWKGATASETGSVGGRRVTAPMAVEGGGVALGAVAAGAVGVRLGAVGVGAAKLVAAAKLVVGALVGLGSVAGAVLRMGLGAIRVAALAFVAVGLGAGFDAIAGAIGSITAAAMANVDGAASAGALSVALSSVSLSLVGSADFVVTNGFARLSGKTLPSTGNLPEAGVAADIAV